MIRSLFLLIGFCVFLASSTHATLISYDIMVEVTSAPESPGSFPPNTDWIFKTIPATFTGTFMADDMLAGPISALSLVIGGLDVEATYPPSVFNLFYPFLPGIPNPVLLWWGFGGGVTFNSIVMFGDAVGTNRVVAVQDSSDGPVLDPILQLDQNWEGTFSITPTAAPEPSTILLLATGLLGVMRYARRRK